MDFIKHKAEQYLDGAFHNDIMQPTAPIVSDVKRFLNGIHNSKDKATYLSVILERTEAQKIRHLASCKSKSCDAEENFSEINYYLLQELNLLGIRVDENTFTHEEKSRLEQKIDQLIEEIAVLKNGQQITYEDFHIEMEEMKNLFLIGKKSWYQLFGAKVADMVAGGIISETIAHSIVESMKSFTQLILQN